MKKLIFIFLIACMTIAMTACNQNKSQLNMSTTRVDSDLEPSIIAEPLKEEKPTKLNHYGFEGDFLTAGNVKVFYPVTDHVKNETEAYDKGIPIETELQLTRPADWMLLQTEDKDNAILIEIEQSHLKIMAYKKGSIVPAGCELDLGDGNFLNYAKIIAYEKNNVLYIHSDYPSSAAYESIYLIYKNNELKLLENKNGDTMIDAMSEMKAFLSTNQTEKALALLTNFEVEYPETYMQELITLNKLFFFHLTEKAKNIQNEQPDLALNYYSLALSLVVMTEMNGENDYETPYLAYDIAMQASESDPEISNQLLETRSIAQVLSRYIQLLKKENRPISDHLQELSKILNHNMK